VAYHPQSNGVVGRSNKAVKNALAALVQRTPQWPVHLPSVRLALNTALHLLVCWRPSLTNVQTADEGLIVQQLADDRCLVVEVSPQTLEANKAHYDQAANSFLPDVICRVHDNQMRSYKSSSEMDFSEERDELPGEETFI